jgi:hypothetical protein
MPNEDNDKSIGGNLTGDILDDDSKIITATTKEVDRKVLPTDVQDYIRDSDKVQMWETDPATLRDYANNTFVQSYIDQISKDVSSTDWSTDSDMATKFLKNASPRYSWSELLEATTREVLETGNAFWGIHYDNGEIAEVVLADSQTMFIVEDEMGYIDGYVQSVSGGHGSNETVLDTDEIVHFTWGSSVSRDYASSPVEKSLDIIDILDQLLLEDVNNLRAGAVNGVIGVDDESVNDQELKKIIKQIAKQDQGKRHKVSAVRGDVSFENINDNFGEMQILDRYGQHIRNLSTHFKVSPEYIGFASSDGGIGQGKAREEERKNHREGVQVVLSQIEDKINEELIRPEFDAEFRFEVEDEDAEETVQHYNNLGKTSQQLQEAGIPHRIEDGELVVEDAEFSSDTQPEQEPAPEEEEVTTKPDKLDECVQSVMEDNPDLSESEAFAICNDQLDIEKEVPDKYLDERDKGFFVPNDTAAEQAKQAIDWHDEHSDEIDAFGEGAEGLDRAEQLVAHNEENEALDIKFWEEIKNFHARHRAQDNHELDSEFEGEPWKDNGYISDLAWGSDAGLEQAERVMELVEEVDGEEESEEESEKDDSLSERKAELLKVTGQDTLEEALSYVEEENDTRVDAIRQCQTMLSGTLSQSTYYDWLDECELR